MEHGRAGAREDRQEKGRSSEWETELGRRTKERKKNRVHGVRIRDKGVYRAHRHGGVKDDGCTNESKIQTAGRGENAYGQIESMRSQSERGGRKLCKHGMDRNGIGGQKRAARTLDGDSCPGE